MTSDGALKAAAKRELAFRRARKDVLWCASQWWIQHPKGPRPWDLYDSQQEILTEWDSGQDCIHLKARQLGFSTSVAFFAFRVAFFREGVSVMLISRGERESQELLDKVKFGYERLPQWMKDRGPKVKHWTLSKVEFDNGSEIISLPSANNPARGFTGALVVVDEWAFLPNAEEAWAAIEPVADIGGQIIGLSTANGVGNMFHTLWKKAENGQVFKPMFYPWTAVPGRDQDWYQRKAEALLPWQLHQEYPSDPEEAFIKSGASVFNVAALKELEHIHGGKYRLESPDTSGVRLVPSADGEVEVWEQPVPHRVYVLGVDVAEGLGHGDFSSVHVLDVVTRKVVASWHGRIPADLLAEQVYGLGTLYNSALAGVEANNHGLTTLMRLRQLGYPKVFRRRSMNKATKKISIEFGFKTTRGTKAPLIDGLGAWLREDDNDLQCGDTIKELMSYVRADNGSMHGSPHDDRVMSLALGVYMLGFAYQPEYTIETDNTFTLDWWAELADEANEPKSNAIRPL